MQSTIVNPMTTDSQFTTIDGKQTFKANLTCTNAKVSFMKIYYKVAAENKIKIYVDIDTNFDGKKEQHFASAIDAGSICTKGFLNCKSGICNGYTVSYSKSDGFILNNSGEHSVGACICVDSSCGSPSVNAKKGVLEQISNLLYPKVAAANTNIIITKTVANDEYIEFYGENSGQCDKNEGSNFSASKNPQTPNFDYSNPPNADDQIYTTVGDTNSPYNSLLNSSTNYNSNINKVQGGIYEAHSISKNTKTDTIANNPNAEITTDLTYPVYNEDGTVNYNYTNVNANSDVKQELYCEVSWSLKSDDVFSDGTNRANLNSNGTIEKFDIRKCNNNVCPIDSSKGEKISKACGKINNINKAAAAMAIIDQIGKEVICGTQ
ncbi:hypothetical protein [Campylobacter fetus]|uniref:hypothetical protein n=1 Tax=Campylobacter fetus TaxID=196 RepID=UPI001F307831|nr:hypothetical protein [Campylobacter fetus]